MKYKAKSSALTIILVIAVVLILLVGGVLWYIWQKNENNKPTSQPAETTSASTSQQERKYVALGASTTKANNLSTELVGDNPDYSFATGTKIDSVYSYLKSINRNITPVNLAESGVNSQTVLERQVPNALSYHPKYVTIDVMADFLESDSPQKLKGNLEEIITQLKTDDAVVLVGSYPNLIKMRTAPYPSCKEDKLRVGFDKVTTERILAFNQAIKEVAQNSKVEYVENYDVLGPDDVSNYDCIHPNNEGQKKLAQSWIRSLKSVLK